MNKQKVIIVDDHKVFRKGLKIVIDECKFAEVIAEASNGKEFLKIIENTEVDIVFMDINMPNIDGFEATRLAMTKNPSLSIIGMSVNDDIASINKMLSSGAKGYLEKNVDYDEIHQALKNLAKKKNYFSANIFIKLTQNVNKLAQHKGTRVLFNDITKREYDVLQLICKGSATNEISEKLYISGRTVEKHKANLFAKTGTENVLNLALFAFRNDLIDL